LIPNNKKNYTKSVLILFYTLLGLQILYSQPLVGSYTVGGVSPDFATLQDAAHALFINGVSGPVYFNIRPGTYVKQGSAGPVLRIDTLIAGLSSTNRITFQPDTSTGGNRDNTILQIDCDINTDYNNDREIFFIKSNYVTIRNLTFKDADSLDSPSRYLLRIESIVFQPLIEGLVVDGCKFIGSPYYTSGQQFGTDYGIHAYNLNTGTISNNEFSNLMRAAGLDADGFDPGDSIIIDDNKFKNLYIGFSGAGTPLGSAIEERFAHVFIRRNFVSNSAGRNGIQSEHPVTGVIEANYITGNFWSGQLFIEGYNVTDSLLVKNNIIIGGATYGSMYVQTRNTKLLHNTINNISGSGVTLYVSGAQCSIINNIILDFNTGTTLEFGSEAVDLISDHNVFYRSETVGYFAHIAGTYYTTFDDYRLATGKDPNSTFKDIEFEFDSLGIHLDECQAQDQALNGIHLPEVPVDYYGALRDSVKPFVGAVEGVRLPFDMFGEPFRTPLTGFPLSITTGDYDHSNSIGIAVPDWDNNQVVLFHNNGASRTFTQSGALSTSFPPTLAKLYDLDEDNNLDLIVSGNTNAVEVFWGDGNGNFSSSDIVSTSGNVRSIEPGPRFVDFSTIITTEDGFQPSTSLIGYIINLPGRQLCYDVQRKHGPNSVIDTIQAVITDFVLADLGAGENMPAIVAPGIFGSSNVIPKLFAFDVLAMSDFASVCQQANVDFLSSDFEYDFPVAGYYTNNSSVVTGDFDGDLDPDFITTGFDDNYCVLIKNNGNFSFSADTIFTAATRGIAALDYDHDGDLDFVAENNTLDSLGITIFLNDGVGNFEEKRNCFFPFASGHPNGIVAADFDDDGNIDVAIISRTPFGGDSLFILYNLGGLNQTTGVETLPPVDVVPNKFDLSQNYPNPFNPSTKINFNLPAESNVKIFVYNILGQKVRELVNNQLAAGVHTIDFNAGNLASGIYIYTIEAKTVSAEGNFIKARKMVLMK
jgi:Secretion system C-terminal sorting domain/FG-GAP-like repeat/Right handed beta helix region